MHDDKISRHVLVLTTLFCMGMRDDNVLSLTASVKVMHFLFDMATNYEHTSTIARGRREEEHAISISAKCTGWKF